MHEECEMTAIFVLTGSSVLLVPFRFVPYYCCGLHTNYCSCVTWVSTIGTSGIKAAPSGRHLHCPACITVALSINSRHLSPPCAAATLYRVYGAYPIDSTNLSTWYDVLGTTIPVC